MAPLPGYVSNHVPCAGTRFSADFRGYPGVALRRLGRSVRIGGYSGGTDPLRPDRLDVHLFRNGKGVIDLNAEIPDGALNLGVAEQ